MNPRAALLVLNIEEARRQLVALWVEREELLDAGSPTVFVDREVRAKEWLIDDLGCHSRKKDYDHRTQAAAGIQEIRRTRAAHLRHDACRQ
jgi:hypothetical protein